jgi:YVTN family beta-propeller protein
MFRVHPRLAKRFATTCLVLAGCTALALLVTVSLAGAKAAVGPKAYVGLVGASSVAVMDTANNQLLGTIPVPAGPHGLAITPNNSLVYVSSDSASTVSIIDTTIDQVIGSIDVGPSPHGLAITPDGSSVLVAAFGSDMVTAIDTATNEVTWSIPLTSADNFAISPDGLTAYVASQDEAAPSLAIVSLPDQLQVGSVPLASIPLALSFSPDGSQLWFTQAGVDDVQVLDPATGTIVASIPVGAGPNDVLFTPTGQLGLVVSQDAGELTLLDPFTGVDFATVTVGALPSWAAVTFDGLTAYVTDQGSNQVSVVDLTTAMVTDTVTIGAAPGEIVVQTAPIAVLPQATPVPVPQVSPTTPAAPPPAATVNASIANFAFPPTLTVAVQGSVTWTNMDPDLHTTTSDMPGWDSGPMSQGDTFTTTFAQPGTYFYHCDFHSFMHGTVIVS